MITKKRTCEVAIHFNKEPHALQDFEFLIIEQLCNLSAKTNTLDDRLLTRQAFWWAQLSTLKPQNSIFFDFITFILRRVFNLFIFYLLCNSYRIS